MCSPFFESQILGIGLRAHMLPGGLVTFPATNTALSPIGYVSEPLFHFSTCLVGSKSRCPRWKHSSVSGSDAGHSRYE